MPLINSSIRIGVAVAWLLACAMGSLRADDEVDANAQAVGGLRMRLQVSEAEKGEGLPARLEVVLQNVGESDLNVNLGSSLANGQFHLPTAIRLFALSDGAKARTLTYSLRVAGRLDPFVVPLPAGSTYTLRIGFDKFADSETGERLDLTAKDYRFVAELVGEVVATEGASGRRDYALMSFWQGKVTSNEIQFPLAKKTVQ